MKKYLYLAVFVLPLFWLAGCQSGKNIIYLEDMVPDLDYEIKAPEKTTIQPNDRLNIVVECPTKPELAIPFKIRQGTYQVDGQGNITIQRTNNGEENVYEVDEEGYIEFPLLGKFSLEDMTLDEAKEFLAEAIQETGLIKNPSVDVRFLGFNYTVLGAIGGVGLQTSNKDRMTIIEAIAKAGGVSGNARPDRVCVIREENGVRRIYYNDIRTTDIFYSPCYYLHPNDILYVQPKERKRDTAEEVRYYLTYTISMISAITSILVFFRLK